MSTVDGICRRLADEGIGAYSPGTILPADGVPITVAGWPSKAGRAICVTTYDGGPEPDTRNAWEYPRVQIKVRDSDPLAALTLDRQVYDLLQASPGAYPIDLPHAPDTEAWTLGDCYALQSEPAPLGRDDNGLWEYARNYQLTCWRA